MMTAPADRTFGKRLRELAITRYDRAWDWWTGVLLVDHQGQVIQEMRVSQWREKGPEVRDALLAEGRLRAVVHLGVADYERLFAVHCIEVYDDPEHPTVHALIGGKVKSSWIPINDDIADAWIGYLKTTEGGTDTV